MTADLIDESVMGLVVQPFGQYYHVAPIHGTPRVSEPSTLRAMVANHVRILSAFAQAVPPFELLQWASVHSFCASAYAIQQEVAALRN